MGVGAEKRQCLSPAPFSAHRKLAQIRSKPPRNPALVLGCCPPLKEVTQRLTGANKGYFCVVLVGMIQQSRRNRMCAFTACVRFLRRCGPAGLREPFLWLQRGHFCAVTRPVPNVETIGQNRTSTASSANPSRAARSPSLVLGYCPPLKNRTQRLTGANTGFFCAGVLWDDIKNTFYAGLNRPEAAGEFTCGLWHKRGKDESNFNSARWRLPSPPSPWRRCG